MNVLELVALVETTPATTIAYKLGGDKTYHDHASCALDYLSKPTRTYVKWHLVRVARFGEFDPKWFCSSCERMLCAPCPRTLPDP